MPKILVADDNADLLSLLGRRLEVAGFEVLTATDGVEALAVIDAHPDLALVVLDVGMPEVNGFQVCQQLKDRGREDLPIILLTARDSEADLFWGMELGAALYLTKPLEPTEVVERVRQVLAARAPSG